MQTQRIVDGTLSPVSTLVRSPVVPQRSARRVAARRASDRRATARKRNDDVEGRIVHYLRDHPQRTTGEIAKGLNADDGSTCRYCLAQWSQSGPSAEYTFLYRV